MELLASRMDPRDESKEDTAEFSVLFKAHYSQAVRQILPIVREQAIAEELAQEVFIKLYSVDRSEIENLRAWLAKVSIHVAFNYLRSEKRRAARDDRATQREGCTSPSTEESWLRREEIAAVRETLVDLDERDRLLLLMKYSGYDYKELAQAAGIEKGSVGTLLARAKKKFRELYQHRRGSET